MRCAVPARSRSGRRGGARSRWRARRHRLRRRRRCRGSPDWRWRSAARSGTGPWRPPRPARAGARPPGPGPAALLAGLLRDAAGAGRPRVPACLELQTEAARRPWLAALLDPVGAADFAAHRRLLGAAGLPDGPAQARTLTLARHGAVWHLLTGAPDTLAAARLDDLDAFAGDVLVGVRPGPSGEES
ncbi:hypothetical protein [Streptomyces sp. NPDC004050]